MIYLIYLSDVRDVSIETRARGLSRAESRGLPAYTHTALTAEGDGQLRTVCEYYMYRISYLEMAKQLK